MLFSCFFDCLPTRLALIGASGDPPSMWGRLLQPDSGQSARSTLGLACADGSSPALVQAQAQAYMVAETEVAIALMAQAQATFGITSKIQRSPEL